MVACYSEFSHSVVRGDIWINDNGMIKIGPQARNQFARSTIALYAWVLPTRPWLQLKINFDEKNIFVSYKICIQDKLLYVWIEFFIRII